MRPAPGEFRAEDDPGLTAPQLWVNRSLEHASEAHAYGAEGLLTIHWRTRQVAPQVSAIALAPWNAELTASDVWLEWSKREFGATGDVAQAAADVFASIDSYQLPRPVVWGGGPGNFTADPKQCGVNYTFVDAFISLSTHLEPKSREWERWEYWALTFKYMRSISALECTWSK